MNLLLSLLAATAQPPDQVAVPDEAEILVIAPARQLAPLPAAIEYFRRHCFDAGRLTGRPAVPDDTDTDWQAAPARLRASLRIGQAASAFALADRERGHSLVLTIDRPARNDGLTEHRCTLMVIGGGEHAALDAGMEKLFRGAGTRRHIGHEAGDRHLKGWRQQAWTGTPRRGSSDWHSYPARRTAEGSFVVVAGRSFYNRRDYLWASLKQSEARTPPVSILSLSYTTRGNPRRN